MFLLWFKLQEPRILDFPNCNLVALPLHTKYNNSGCLQCTLLHHKNCSSMARGTWHSTQDIDLASGFPWYVPEELRPMEAPPHNLQDRKDLILTPRSQTTQDTPQLLCPCLHGSEQSPIHDGVSIDRTCSSTSYGFSIRLRSDKCGGLVDASRQFFIPLLSSQCAVAGRTVLLGIVTATGECCCHEVVYLVDNVLWVGGACQGPSVS